MNKWIHFLLIIFVSEFGYSQTPTPPQNTTFFADGNDYIGVNNYAGGNFNISQTNLVFENGDATPLYIQPGWKITARVLSSEIRSSDGTKVLPADKVLFDVSSTSGTMLSVPTITQIGIPPDVLMSEMSEVYLVPSSLVPLNGKAYYSRFQINYIIKLAGGTYLGDLENQWFYFEIEFSAYDKNNNLIGQRSQKQFRVQILELQGTPPAEDQYSIQIVGGAANGLLEMSTLNDYINGVSVTYPQSLIVTTNVDYEVKVKSIEPEFSSINGYSLDLDTVHLDLIPNGNSTGITVFPISISTSAKKILEGGSTSLTSKNLDIKYFTSPNNPKLISAQPDEYSTTLQYQITPR